MIEVNRIYNEDAFTFLKKVDSDFIDLTVTSPPYDELRKYNGFSFDFENIANELYRATKPGGVIVWVVGDATINGSETGTSFKQALYFKEIGFNLHDTMIYQKQNFIPLSHNRYEQEFEFMFILTKGKPKTFNPIETKSKLAGVGSNMKRNGYGFKEGAFRRRNEFVMVKDTKRRGNIWDYSTGNSGVNHPAPFPEKLVADHIYTWSNEGEIICDCFMGSATTAKAAILQNRNWIGCEISKQYVENSLMRLSPIINQQRLKF
jgi:DNA modification methylase